jgi:hypothetical protein
MKLLLFVMFSAFLLFVLSIFILLHGEDIEKLQKLRDSKTALKFYFYCNYIKGYKFTIVETKRTPERQVMYYAQGRINDNAIITNANETNGLHLQGRAFDIQPINCTYEQIAQVAEIFGYKWGGNFTTIIDKPHLEK